MMSIFLTLLQSVPAAQKTASEAAGGGNGDINQYTWVIITALAGLIVTMGGFGGKFIMRLYSDLENCRAERAKFVESQLSLLQTLKKEFEKPKQ